MLVIYIAPKSKSETELWVIFEVDIKMWYIDQILPSKCATSKIYPLYLLLVNIQTVWAVPGSTLCYAFQFLILHRTKSH